MKKFNRILIILEDTVIGGAETQALILCRGLVNKGFEVHVISFGSHKGPYWNDFVDEKIKMHLTGFKSKLLLPPFKNFKKKIYYLRYYIRLVRLIRSIQPYAILPFTYPPNIIMARCWRFTNAKACYWNQRDAGIAFQGMDWEIKALNNCTEIVSNSLEGALFLKKHTNRKVSIIHNGVVLPELSFNNKVNEKIRVVMIANLNKNKDHITLLKAWKKIVDKNKNRQLELVLAGKQANAEMEIKKYIYDNNIENYVICIGLIRDVPKLLKSSDIGVFSSVKEGLPNGILECMAMGLPVVSTKITGSEEALGEDYPFLVEPFDEDTFAHMILELIEDADLRKRIGLQNLIRIKENFGVEKMVNQFISLINL